MLKLIIPIILAVATTLGIICAKNKKKGKKSKKGRKNNA